MKISLSRGKSSIIDDEDFPKICGHAWMANTNNGSNWYAVAKIDGKMVKMHHIIMGRHDEDFDHKDGDGLNNRKINLRPCTSAQNGWNRRKIKKKSSKFKGVHYCRRDKCFRSYIVFHGKKIFAGCFKDETEAAKSYDKKARELYGEFCRTNFEE